MKPGYLSKEPVLDENSSEAGFFTCLEHSMADRVIFFIDGFNVYHALANRKYSKYKWLNYKKFAECFISPKKEVIQEILYFTAYAHWNKKKHERHKMYVQALKFHGIHIVFGKFKKVTRECRADCKKRYETFEEKETDVNIAIYLMKKAFQDEFDTAYIISGDSDLVPAVENIKSMFPHKNIKCIIPIARSAEHIKKVCDSHNRMKEKHLRTSQFPDCIVVDSIKNIVLKKPAEWP